MMRFQLLNYISNKAQGLKGYEKAKEEIKNVKDWCYDKCQ